MVFLFFDVIGRSKYRSRSGIITAPFLQGVPHQSDESIVLLNAHERHSYFMGMGYITIAHCIVMKGNEICHVTGGGGLFFGFKVFQAGKDRQVLAGTETSLTSI